MFGIGRNSSLKNDLSAWIQSSLAEFASAHPHAAITGVEFKYERYQEDRQVWVQLDLHTDPDWELGMSEGEIAFPAFAEIELDTPSDPPDEARLGKLLLAIHKQGSKSGLYTPLPKAATCTVGIEHIHGEWGWLDPAHPANTPASKLAAATPADESALKEDLRAWLARTFESFAAEHPDAKLTGVQIHFEAVPDLQEVWAAMALHTLDEWEPASDTTPPTFLKLDDFTKPYTGKPPTIDRVGALLLEVHQEACGLAAEGSSQSVYAPLPRADRFRVTIDHLLGKWSWPEPGRRDDGLVPSR